MNCLHCHKTIELVPSAAERARKFGGVPSDYTALFAYHAACTLELRAQNSVKWLSEHLSLIKEGGTWFIPRSGNAYTIIHSRKTAVHAMELLPDPSLDKVFIAAGWTVEKSISK